MTSRVQITFRRSLPSEVARDVVTQKFDKLAHQLPYTARCHVVVDGPRGGLHKGAAAFTARVDIQGIGMPLCTAAEHRDLCAAIREAFERAEVQARKNRESRDARSARPHGYWH